MPAVPGVRLAAEPLHLLEAGEHRLAVVLETARVVDHDPLQTRQVGADTEDLVGLLLVLHHHDPRLAVLDDVAHLVGQAVDVDSDRDRAERLGAQLRVEPRRPVAADDREGLASPQAERLEAEGDGADVRRVVLPRHFLPDAVLLLAQGDLAAAVAPGMGGQHLREGHATSTSSPR